MRPFASVLDFSTGLVGEYLAKNARKIAKNPKDLAEVPAEVLQGGALGGASVPASVVSFQNPEHIARVMAEVEKFQPSRKCKQLEAVRYLLQGLSRLAQVSSN